MPVNLDALKPLLRRVLTAHARADDYDLIASVAQRARLLPDPPVERAG
jgi:hypothetical protein